MPPRKKIQWQSLSYETALRAFATDPGKGLSIKECERRLLKYGQNIFKEKKKSRSFEFLLEQAKDPLVLILFIAGIVTFILGEYLDTVVIFAALAVNLSIGAFQKRRTGKIFSTLNATQEKFAFVLRDGRKKEVKAADIVPGDILLLEAGRSVAADARLIAARGLFIDESAITGEWLAVEKNAEKTVPRGQPLGNQINMVWMGTLAAGGSGEAVVVATGRRTQFGEIVAKTLSVGEEKTPLQKNIRAIAILLTFVILALVGILVAAGLFAGESPETLFLLAVAIAVAAVPSGLPAAVTVVLALGMESILKKGGLMRNLLGTETLGSTTVILTDKTGTLTEAQMRIYAVAAGTSLARIESGEKAKSADFLLWNNDERTVLFHAVAVSDAFVEWNLARNGGDALGKELLRNAERVTSGAESGAMSSFIVRGRPIERAVIMGGIEAGILQEDILKEHPRTDFLEFDSSRQFAASVHKKMGTAAHRLILAGAPEYMLAHSSFTLGGGKKIAMTKEIKKIFADFQERRGSKGERLIAVAWKDMNEKAVPRVLKENPDAFKDGGVVFAGFIIFSDPIRVSAKKAVVEAQEAGIRVIMVTGDNPATAVGVAEAVGIWGKNDPVAEGSDFEKKDAKGKKDIAARASVFARMLPRHKQELVELLQASGDVVAMTGDGLNDAPALRKADIGIALQSGTDVAKESSDLILIENGLGIIVLAVKAGRKIIDNLKKILAYLFSTSFSEIFLVGGAFALGGPLPLLPAQILWINIIEESFMNFAFAFEPEEPDIMRRDPRWTGEGILTRPMKLLIGIIAAATGAFLIVLYAALVWWGMPEEKLRTVMFVAVAVDSIFFSFSFKSFTNPLWRVNFFSNKYLLAALLFSILALFAALQWSPLMTLLSLEPLGGMLFLLLFGLGIINVAMIEITKYFVFREGE